MIDKLKKQIQKTGYIKNRKIGGIIPSKYPKLYTDVINNTVVLNNGPVINQTFRARAIFIFKYDGQLNQIIKDNQLMVFNRKLDDFRLVSAEYVKDGWKNCKEKLYETNTVYNKIETINMLKKDNYYLMLFGKAKNRTLIKTNPKLYRSIYHHTSALDDYDKCSNSFYVRIQFLVKYNGEHKKIVCKTCGKKTSFNRKLDQFVDYCADCFPKYPSKKFFKYRYGKDWEIKYLKDKEHRKSLKTNSKSWFIKKYGEDIGLQKYYTYADKQIENLNKVTTKRYSKISQDLFWAIYERLSDEQKAKCYFKTLNFEKIIKDPAIGCYYFPDFVFDDKKIIEYDGIYWHNADKDQIRNNFYKKMGYNVLIITENEFDYKKKPVITIENCIDFLLNEN